MAFRVWFFIINEMVMPKEVTVCYKWKWHDASSTIYLKKKKRKGKEINTESMSTELIRKPYNKTCFCFKELYKL